MQASAAPPGYPTSATPWQNPPAEKTPPKQLATAQQRGPYFGARVGAGGPFGGDSSRTGSYKEGFGLVLEAGYAILPYLGLNAFFHYNRTAVMFPDSLANSYSENSGHVTLYGLEARGILPVGKLVSWASLGFSLGSGSLTLSQNNGSFSGGTTHDDASLSLNPAAVFGFGAEYEVANRFFLGPEIRWYVLSAEKACDKFSDPVGGISGNQCTSDFSNVTIPDIVYLGVGATYRMGLGE